MFERRPSFRIASIRTLRTSTSQASLTRTASLMRLMGRFRCPAATRRPSTNAGRRLPSPFTEPGITQLGPAPACTQGGPPGATSALPAPSAQKGALGMRRGASCSLLLPASSCWGHLCYVHKAASGATANEDRSTPPQRRVNEWRNLFQGAVQGALQCKRLLR